MSAGEPARSTYHPRRRPRGPYRLAITLALVGVLVIVLGFATRLGELAVVSGLALIFLAGGVLNWDRRTGH
jgi:hypothetical protein